jgi:hypothetical protein
MPVWRGGAEKEAEKKRERQKIEGAESAEILGLRSRIEECTRRKNAPDDGGMAA